MELGFLGVPDVDATIFAGLALTSFCTAFIAGVTGTAGGLLMLGILALVFPPAVLIPLHTVVMLGDNVSRIAILRRHILRAALLPFFIGAALGALLGVTLGAYLPLMAAMVVTAALGNLVGSRVLNRMPEQAFRMIFRIVLTALALRILWLAAENAGLV